MHFHLRELTPDDVDLMMDLEARAFESAMQASRETYLRRFSLGHIALGAFSASDARLVGVISFYYDQFSREDFAGFPKTFPEYSSQPASAEFAAMCIYNLGISPEARSYECARLLIQSAFDRGKRDGCRDVFGEGPIPSYAGNDQVPANPAVHEMIEHWERSGQRPTRRELIRDPVLALYHRLTGCKALWLMPKFCTSDTASGGYRVILYRDLTTWVGSYASPAGVHASACLRQNRHAKA